MTKFKMAMMAVAGGALLTAATGTLWAQTARTATRAAARLDPVTLDVVPVAAPPVVVAAPAAPVVAAAERPTRPPIIATRSTGRPAPILPIPF